MGTRFKGLFYIGLSLLLIMAFSLPASASESSHDISTPTPMNQQEDPGLSGEIGNGNDETPGQWYLGDTPPDMDDDSPVLLFVHGLNSKAQVWWEDNDMYETAYEAGYQTTFVQLHDVGGEAADMWRNGELLSRTIQNISEYFDDRSITIVAHSKGGVDSQTALSTFDAWKYVDNVITLSSPHHGTQLADLAYSFWAGWLANLIGMQDDGTYVMQTGYMDDFRSTMNQQPKAYYNDYFTMGGTEWGSPFSSTWFGGIYLSTFGDNDGVVPSDSSALERGQEIAVGNWDHTTIRTGETFPFFENKLTGTQNKQNTALKDEKNGQPSSTNQWVHGGELVQGENEGVTVSVEENVDKITFDLMTNEGLEDVTLISPDGKRVDPELTTADTEKNDYFGDATHHAITLEKPESGEWEIQMTMANPGAYLLTADYHTDTEQKLYYHSAANQKMQATGNKHTLDYQLEVDSQQVNKESLEATYHVTEAGDTDQTKTWTTKGSNLSSELSFAKPERVYNITIDVKGETLQGAPFQRTIIDSVYTGED